MKRRIPTFLFRRTFCITALSLGLCLGLGASKASSVFAAAPDNNPLHAIIHAKVEVGDGTTLEDATIVLKDGKIASLRAKANGAGVPAGAAVFDARGHVVTPGLIAADTPIGLVEIEAESSTDDRRAQDQQVVHAAYQSALGVHADSSLLPVAIYAGVTNAAVTPSTRLFGGQVAFIDLLPGDYRNIVVEPRAAQRANLGAVIDSSRIATIARFEQTLDEARLYRTKKAAFERSQLQKLSAPASDLAALDPVLRRKQRLLVGASRASDILAALDIAKRYRLNIAIVGAQEGWKVADALSRARVPVVLRASDNLPGSFDKLASRLDNAALLDRAGVALIIAEIGSAHNVRNIRQLAGIAVANGLPWQKGLAALTSEVAKLYGLQKDYGTVSRGKVANLVVWTGDPLEFSSHPAAVYLRGRPTSLQSRQTLLRDRYRELRRFSVSAQ